MLRKGGSLFPLDMSRHSRALKKHEEEAREYDTSRDEISTVDLLKEVTEWSGRDGS